MRTALTAALAIVLAFGCADQPTTPTATNEAVPAPLFNTDLGDLTCDELEALLVEKTDKRNALEAKLIRLDEQRYHQLVRIDGQIKELRAEYRALRNLPLPDVAIQQRMEMILALIGNLQDQREALLESAGIKFAETKKQLTEVNKEIGLIQREINERCLP